MRNHRLLTLTVLTIATLMGLCYFRRASEQDQIHAGPNRDFTFQGTPIHPGCLEEFHVWLSDVGPPRVLSIDLTSCMRSNKYTTFPVQEHDGFLFYSNPDSNESFGYRCLGTTTDGLHVLDTWNNGGGSGFFYTVMLIRFETLDYAGASVVHWRGDLTQSAELEKRIVLRCVGQVNHGDRDDGEIRLVGNNLVLGKSRYRDKDLIVQLPEADAAR